ncbi:hypothetical protein EBB07_28735 [Paenibacillaceae bacterium]|nr:hypothetical protein EBB07_28735 [Paenibacillaceae bacterium]
MLIKSDWSIAREAEEKGLMAAMTNVVERKRTKLNNELSSYFRSKLPDYKGSYGEDDSEETLELINDYMQSKNSDKCKSVDRFLLRFPVNTGTENYLVPITPNLQLKVIVCDEYYGNGEYEKYIMIKYFTITEQTTKTDVDELVSFVEAYLM